MSSVLSQGTLIRLDVSIWSARARLQTSDLPDNANIPPESLVTLGSKRLYRQDLLRPFGKLKARALNLLDRTGMRFLGGWLVRDDLVDELELELKNIAAEFSTESSNFALTYGAEVGQWLDQYPQWRHILVNAVPKVTDIGRKFGFDWQSYKIQPATDHSRQQASTVVDAAVQDIARASLALFEETFKDRSTVTPKAWRPVRTLIGKLDAMSYIDARVEAIRHKLAFALDAVQGKHTEESAVARFKATLVSLTHEDVVEAELAGGTDGGGALDVLLQENVVDAPVDAPQQQDETFDSEGLW